jgi:hypothetical protein
MAFTSLGPEEFEDPELPFPVLPLLPELPNAFPNGEPLPNGLFEEPEPPDELEPPEFEGTRAPPEVGLKACVVPALLDVA